MIRTVESDGKTPYRLYIRQNSDIQDKCFVVKQGITRANSF